MASLIRMSLESISYVMNEYRDLKFLEECDNVYRKSQKLTVAN